MKKLVLIVLIICSFLFIGCDNNASETKDDSLNDLTTTTKIEIKKEWTKESFSDNKVVTNLNSLKELIVALNNLKIKKQELDNYQFDKAMYLVECGSKKIYFINSKTIYVKEDDTLKYTITEGNIEFLDSIFINRTYQFNEFKLGGEIVVKSIEKNKEAKITDETKFYEQLNAIQFKKIEINELNAEYIIYIGQTQIEVANDYLKMNNAYYNVVKGNFDFLKQLNYNSSGWLPWV